MLILLLEVYFEACSWASIVFLWYKIWDDNEPQSVPCLVGPSIFLHWSPENKKKKIVIGRAFENIINYNKDDDLTSIGGGKFTFYINYAKIKGNEKAMKIYI